MPKITNLVLAEKIDNLAKRFEDIKGDCKANTNFRLQFKGFAAAIVLISSLFATGLVWVGSKIKLLKFF